MPKTKSLLKRHEIEVAKARRTCKFSNKHILKGELCLVIYDAPRRYKTYCKEVAIKILDRAESQLSAIKKEFSCNDDGSKLNT